MKATSISCLAALFIIGCGSEPDPTSSPRTPTGSPEIQVPDMETPTRISLHLWDRELRVGDRSEVAAQVFPMTSRVLESNEKPSVFGDRFRTRIWNADSEGFGVILHDGKVAAALAHSQSVTQDRVREIVQLHMDKLAPLEPEFVTSKHTQYWFWEDEDQRLMICTLVKDKTQTLTVAMGVISVLDAIGASPIAALNASRRADDLLSEQKAGESAP